MLAHRTLQTLVNPNEQLFAETREHLSGRAGTLFEAQIWSDLESPWTTVAERRLFHPPTEKATSTTEIAERG